MLTLLLAIGIGTPILVSLVATGKQFAETINEHRKHQKNTPQTTEEQELHIGYVKKMNKAKRTMTEIYFYSKKIENRKVKQKAYRADRKSVV